MTVNALEYDGNYLYAGGETPATLAKIDVSTGGITSLAVTGGSIKALALKEEDLYVGGSFTQLGTSFFSHFGRIKTHGFSVDDTFKITPDRTVNALALFEDNIYLGGDFTSIDISGTSYTRKYSAKINPNTI